MSKPEVLYKLHQSTVINNFTEKENAEELTEAECALIKERLREVHKQTILKLLHRTRLPTSLEYCMMATMPRVHHNINALMDRRILLDEENTISKINVTDILKNSE